VLMKESHWLIRMGSAVDLFTIIHKTRHLLVVQNERPQSGFVLLLRAGNVLKNEKGIHPELLQLLVSEP